MRFGRRGRLRGWGVAALGRRRRTCHAVRSSVPSQRRDANLSPSLRPERRDGTRRGRLITCRQMDPPREDSHEMDIGRPVRRDQARPSERDDPAPGPTTERWSTSRGGSDGWIRVAGRGLELQAPRGSSPPRTRASVQSPRLDLAQCTASAQNGKTMSNRLIQSDMSKTRTCSVRGGDVWLRRTAARQG